MYIYIYIFFFSRLYKYIMVLLYSYIFALILHEFFTVSCLRKTSMESESDGFLDVSGTPGNQKKRAPLYFRYVSHPKVSQGCPKNDLCFDQKVCFRELSSQLRPLKTTNQLM